MAESSLAENVLRGRRLRLGTLLPADAETVVSWQQDAGYLRMLQADPAFPGSPDELKKKIEESHKEPRTAYLFAIRLLEGDRLIGFAALDSILWPHQVGWLAIGIGERPERGKGYGEEAMRLLLNFAFFELNLHRVQLTVFDYNERAIALYERLGFRREGSFREFMRRDGRRYDMHLYGLLAQEWPAPE